MSDEPPKNLVADLAARRERLRNGPELLVVVDGRERTCLPHRFAIDSEAKTVRCKRCEREFTAFDALEYLARDWTRYAENLRQLKASVGALTTQEKDLKRRVQNLKARVVRAEAKR